MALVKPAVITKAWAVNGNFDVPPATASTTVANQATGYPLLQSTPYTSGGLPVTREQTNGAFNLYSSIIAWQQGGGTFTFESTVSTAYSGYNIGAMLAYTRTDGSYGLLYSASNSNVANFVSTPSVIGTNWIDISVGALPDVVDTISTGSVVIGGRVNAASQTIRTLNSAISGSSSTITTSATGSYTNAILNSTNGTSGNTATAKTGYILDNNSVYKPVSSLISQISAGGYTVTVGSAVNNETGFVGLAAVCTSAISSTTYSTLQNYPDSANNPLGTWYLYSGGALKSGLKIYNDGANWMRPEVIATSITALGTTPRSVSLLQDIQRGIDTTNGSGTITITLSTAMPSVSYSVFAQPTSGTVITNTAVISTTQFTITTKNTSGTGLAAEVYWLAVWGG